MSDATSVDPTAVLFGLEEEFSVLKVQRIDATKVKMIIEQTAREGPCPACGVLTSAVKERPLRRLKDLPASGQMLSCGGASAGWSAARRSVGDTASPRSVGRCARTAG